MQVAKRKKPALFPKEKNRAGVKAIGRGFNSLPGLVV